MTLSEHLAEFLQDDDTSLLGQVVMTRCPETKKYRAYHLDDRSTHEGDLRKMTSVKEISELTEYDKSGEHRHLKTAPSLKSGWLIEETEISSFFEKIDAIYPGGLRDTISYYKGNATPSPLRNILEKHSKRQPGAKNITDTHANQIMRNICAKGCLRKISWPIDESCPVSRLPPPDRKIPIICLEACCVAVAEAQKISESIS